MSCYDPLMESGLDSKIFKYFGLCHVLDLVRLYAYKHQLSRYSPKKVALHYNYMKKYTPKYSLFNWKCCCDVAPHNMNLELVFIVLLEYNSR